MKNYSWFSLAALVMSGAAALSEAADSKPPASLFGFTASQSEAQRALESRFDAQIDARDLEGWMKTMAAEANQVGAPHDKANAEMTRDLFRQWGWDAQIETFDVLYPTLKTHTLELVGPTKFTATLSEGAVAGDATSARADGMSAYNAYGADGDVTAELVYLNYGMPKDYEDLARRGIDVKGKIVITRYGAGWRGLKPKLAQEHGAVGCIIYSDPQNDGYATADVYPKGSARPPQGLQRGSVQDMPTYSGDPLTPGVGATKNAKRLPIAQAKTILKIPVIPISYADAQPFLAALEGPVVPPSWRGGLPITYHFGPGPAKVHLAIDSDWSLKTLYDVIAKIPGSESPDEWIVRGNHRDGWVYGAWDPLSGHGAMLAEAKAIGALLKSGWKPKRTLVYASWDGEEPGLLGSTEWAETHAAELKQKAVLYLNSDTNARGFFGAGGSHSYQRLVNDVARGVQDPKAHVSVLERLRAQTLTESYEGRTGPADRKAVKAATAGGDLPIDALGSGSDFTPFLQHLGVASLDVAYGGEQDPAGVYHSKYDTFEYYVRFVDPGFVYGVLEAQTVGRVILRLANADVLPMQFAPAADAMSGYVDDVHELLDGKRKKADELAKLLENKDFAIADSPYHPLAPPKFEGPVPFIDFAPLDNAMVRVKKSTQAYDASYAKLSSGEITLDAAQRRKLDGLLQGMEQTLTAQQGLPERDWYKHLIYAPGLLTGYGVKTLPGVQEAIDGNRWDEASRYVGITAKALAAYCDRLDQATAVIGAGK